MAGAVMFRSGGKYPYSRFLTMLFLMVMFSGLVVLLGLDYLYVIVVVAVFVPPIMFFSISPVLTRHSLSPAGATIRQGWYFKAFIPASNIKEVGLTDEDVPSRSISYSPRRRRLFVTLSSSPLVYLELQEQVPLPFSSGRPVQILVLSVDDAEQFVHEAGKRLNVRTVMELRCPECRQPMQASATGAPVAPTPGPEHAMIEYIFLIHHDGRLIFQYTGGRLQPLSSSSVSGMLVIIQDFIRDAFKTEGGALRKLEHGDLTILIESGGSAYLAAVISGQDAPDTLRASMRSVLKETDREYGDRLREWDGSVPDGIGKVISQVLWA
jgi:hypothetical protein